ncbi:MAG: hypothetical protein EOO77_21110, partial [Oxalobacteraceae bacterium]
MATTLADAITDDPDEEIRKLKAVHGGWALAARVATAKLFREAALLYHVSRPLWLSHQQRALKVRSPEETEAHNIQLADRHWEHHEFPELVRVTFGDGTRAWYDDPRSYVLSTSAAELSQLIELGVAFGTNLAARRAWQSLSHTRVPPFAYAALLSPLRDAREDAIGEMRRHWDIINVLEADASEGARRLRKELYWLDHSAVRLLYMLFERRAWAPDAPEGQRYLAAMMRHLPDSRIVEETHRHVRLLHTKGANNASTRSARHHACVVSGVLRTRDIPHVEVDYDTWRGLYRDPETRRAFPSSVYEASAAQLPRAWNRLVGGKRAWPSPTPEASYKASAAFVWLQARQDLGLTCPYDASWWSGLAKERQMLRHRSGLQLYVLGTAGWGFAATSLRRDASDAARVHVEANLLFGYIWDPDDWQVIGYRFCRSEGNNVLEESGGVSPFLQAAFQGRCMASFLELQCTARHLGCPVTSDRRSLYSGICAALNIMPSREAHEDDAEDALEEELDPLTEALLPELEGEQDEDFGDLVKKAENRAAKLRKHFAGVSASSAPPPREPTLAESFEIGPF